MRDTICLWEHYIKIIALTSILFGMKETDPLLSPFSNNGYSKADDPCLNQE